MRLSPHTKAIALVASLAMLVSGCGQHGGLGSTFPGTSSVSSSLAGTKPLSLLRQTQRIRALMHMGAASRASRAVGSAGYPVTATPPVRVPAESACVDVLFTPNTPPLNTGGLPVGKFADYSDHPFNYTPPSNCPGPYAKVVLKLHFRVTAGIQYDRTGAIWVGATNIFFGTTAEPSPNASPEWTVERDVTEYAPIFASPSTGQASVYNIVNSQYTGVILGHAELDFYPATSQIPPAESADAVYPLSGGPTGGYVYLDAPTDQMTGTFTLPTNVEAAYLDVFLESQNNDEFWYTCFPNDLASEFDNCGNTAFREGEVSVDGQPAGVVPIYPWIYTGGIDPYLWIPIPGVETLNFAPYRINLTPFAAQLDNGSPHTIAVSVFNDDNYFAGNAALLVYEDHGSQVVTGRLVSNGTAAAPSQRTVERVKQTEYGASGKIIVSATHPVSLSGYVYTSKGRIETRVVQSVRFSNVQKINITNTQFLQDIAQQTTVVTKTTTLNRGKTATSQSTFNWPLNVDYNYLATGSSSATQNVSILQTKHQAGVDQGKRGAESWSLLDTVQSADTLNFTPSGYYPSNGKSHAQYKSLDEQGHCYDKIIKSLDYTITGESTRC